MLTPQPFPAGAERCAASICSNQSPPLYVRTFATAQRLFEAALVAADVPAVRRVG